MARPPTTVQITATQRRHLAQVNAYAAGYTPAANGKIQLVLVVTLNPGDERRQDPQAVKDALKALLESDVLAVSDGYGDPSEYTVSVDHAVPLGDEVLDAIDTAARS